jgi:hypothetical protein
MSESLDILTNVVRDIRDSFVGADFSFQCNPCATFKPKLSADGNQFCFLLGDDLQSGIAGFGDTAYKAMQDFNKNFYYLDISKSNKR